VIKNRTVAEAILSPATVGLTGLQKLYLHRTKITDAGIADLKKSLPDCKIYK